MPTVTPGSLEELAAAVRAGGTVAVRGGGSKWAWGGPPPAVDTVVATTALDAVLEHAAGDLVVRAQAGVRLAALAPLLAEAGQMLALDPPEEGATLGGIVATGATGPRRHLYGGVRDLLIGTTYVLADGTVAKAGGKVVKNVAGYDLCKLFAGSYGTLAVLAEVVFRLHPVPEASRFVSVAPDRLADVLHSQSVPSAVELVDDRLVVQVEGVAAGVDARARSLGGEQLDGPPSGYGQRPWRDGDVGVKVAAEPAALPHVLDGLGAAGASRVSGHAGAGVLYAALPSAEQVPALRERLAPYDGSAILVHGDPGDVDPWGPAHGLDLMRRVKAQFDPERRLAPGRFVGGI